MERYIALLRGVNVGGKNTISMKALKELFEKNGFLEVLTYINSGNIIFSCQESDLEALKTLLESMIYESFGLNIALMLISAQELRQALNNSPTWWDEDEGSKHNAIFVIPPFSVEEIFAQVGAIKPEYEKVGFYGKVIFWSAPLNTFSKTRWSKIVGTAIYEQVTIRNANTTKKLVQLALTSE